MTIFILTQPHIYNFIVVTQVLYGISYALILPTSLEFTIAQFPHEMRGLLVGLWYAASGVGYSFTMNSKYLFMCENEMTCQSVYYYIVKSVIFYYTYNVHNIS